MRWEAEMKPRRGFVACPPVVSARSGLFCARKGRLNGAQERANLLHRDSGGILGAKTAMRRHGACLSARTTTITHSNTLTIPSLQ